MTTHGNNPVQSAKALLGATPAIIALLLGNMLPLVGVLLWDWDVHSIITLYWSENLILGGVTLAKLFHLARFQAVPNMLFFIVHYGAFCGAHGLFIAELFAPGIADSELGEQYPYLGPLSVFIEPVVTIFSEANQLWWWAFFALVASHTVSFLLNYLGHGEYRHESTGSLMSSPYGRIFILHVAVLLGGIAVTELGEPVYLIVVLVLVKIFVDVKMHNREHRRSGRAYAAVLDERGEQL